MFFKYLHATPNLRVFFNRVLTIFPQLPRKALTAAEFVTPLARIDPIYKEEEEQFKVRFVVIAMLASYGHASHG